MNYGLLGEKLAHSFSPQIHSLLGCADYGLIEKKRDELDEFMTRRDFSAINVTIPYKKAVMPYCEHIDSAALEIGCVNTIINRDGKLYGYNTDFSGFLYLADRSLVSFEGKKVLVLGSGATSLTATAAARSRKASSVHTVSRSGDLNYENVKALHPDADIIINTTPLGMYPNNGSAAVDLADFKNLSGVLDVVYNPLRTELIMQAQKLGIPASGGLPMLVAQAIFAEELFFERKFDTETYDSVLREIDAKKRSIILMGMPGCGKSSLGLELARLTARPLHDIDELIVTEAGCTIPEIFAQKGEAHFRDLESKVLRRVGASGGGIISLGGGSLLREENRKHVAQNGFTVYIRRELASLPTDGRPLSSSQSALQEMFTARHPIYSACADCECENSATIDDLAQDVLQKFNSREI